MRAAELLALIAGLIVGGRIMHHHKQTPENRTGADLFAYRWFTGLPLSGAPGDCDRQRFTRPTLAALRSGGTLGLISALCGLLWAPGPTTAILAGAGGGAVAAAAYVAYRAAVGWWHNREYVTPLYEALEEVITWPGPAGECVQIPPRYASIHGAVIRLMLPRNFSGSAQAKRQITETVCARLALEDPLPAWKLRGRRPLVEFAVQLPPPRKVFLEHAREYLAQATDTKLFVGLGRGLKPVWADLDNDSPHIGLSIGSGGGKSVTASSIAAQVLKLGGVVLVLDVKRLSLAWTKGLAGVRYCRTPAEIHQALLWLGKELDERAVKADEGADLEGNTDHVDIGPRILVICEEFNACSAMLKAYWKAVRTPDQPKESPAIEALNFGLFMGRQIRVTCLIITQMLTARSIGGPEARENIGLRLLGRYTKNNWEMMVPEIRPMPRCKRRKGWMQVCSGGDAHETQGLKLTTTELREMAAQGGGVFPLEGRPATTLHVARSLPPVGLAAAINQGVLRMEGCADPLEAARKARQRDPAWPQAKAKGAGGELLYDRDELRAWEATRPRTLAADLEEGA